jgi:hypothetical protein
MGWQKDSIEVLSKYYVAIALVCKISGVYSLLSVNLP